MPLSMILGVVVVVMLLATIIVFATLIAGVGADRDTRGGK